MKPDKERGMEETALESTCRVVELGIEGVPAVAALERACFDNPWPETVYARCLEAGGCRLFGILDRGLLVAYLALGVPAGIREMEVYNIAVAETMRRQGLGRRLLAFALSLAAAKTGMRVMLEVRRGNLPAIRLYESLGFMQVGVRPRYYTDNKEDALVYAWRARRMPSAPDAPETNT